MAALWSAQLVIAMVLNAVVQCVGLGAIASRLAGVQSLKIATSISLFNLFVLVSRLSTLVVQPMLGTLSDHAARAARTAPDPWTVYHALELQLRLVVFAGSIGTVLGALLLPTFLHLFMRGIAAFERLGSVPRAILRLADPRVLFSVARSVRIPARERFSRFSLQHVPMKMLVANTIVTGIYAVGVVAAAYASVLYPAESRTAILLSGIINGIATVSFVLIVDPTSARIMDQAVHGERTLDEVKSMVFFLALTTVLGTLLSQLILYPSAAVIGTVARLVSSLH